YQRNSCPETAGVSLGGINMRQIIKNAFSLAALVLLFAGGAYGQGVFPPPPTGTLPDGATYLIEVPPNWNGTLFLYSHGYVVPGAPNPAFDAGDPVTRGILLLRG